MAAYLMSAYVPDLNDSEDDTVGQIVHCIMRNEGTRQQLGFLIHFYFLAAGISHDQIKTKTPP